MKFPSLAGDIAITAPDMASLRMQVLDHFTNGTGFALATINLDHIVKLRRDAGFAAAYAAHEIIVADGNPIVWLSRLSGQPIELLPGSDLIDPLARMAADEHIPVALLGSTDEVLDAAGAALESKIKGLQVVSKIAPPMGFDPEGDAARAMLQDLSQSGAGLCFLALGAPKQERLAALGRQVAPEVGFVSIGAGLDFIAGAQTRAPKWVRALALEWLWRLMTNPKRLVMRYAECVAVLPGLTVKALGERHRG